jgi:peptide deformylase
MIITNNEDALRVKCEDVLVDEVGELISTLEKELDYSNRVGRAGIGLAAPQIGIAKNIAIVRLGEFNFNLINAKIKQAYHPSIFKDEGCLSFPGRVENTTRFQEILVENNFSTFPSFIATGLLAVVCQHELDHLNSKLFMDYACVPLTNKKQKVGPNDPCKCGKTDPVTGKIKKFKKCCGVKL